MRFRNRKGKWIEIPDGPTAEEELEMDTYAAKSRFRMNMFDKNPRSIRDQAQDDAKIAAITSVMVVE